MSIRPEVERCRAMDNKIVFRTREAAEKALTAFKAINSGHGKVVKCFPHDHWHLTKNRKGVRRTRRG